MVWKLFVIPTNRPMIRDDRTDVMFENEEYKFNAIIEDIKDCVATQSTGSCGYRVS